MSERHARLHLAGILAGLLAGLLLGYLLRPAPPPAARGVDEIAVAPRRPGLEGRALEAAAARRRKRPGAAARPPAPGLPSQPSDPWLEVPEEEILCGDGEVEEVVEEERDERTAEQDRAIRGCLARATLRALDGKTDACVAELIAAAGEGAEQGELLDVCGLFQGADWVQVIDRLRAETTGVAWTWDVSQLAAHALVAGAKAWGWQILEEAFRQAASPDMDVVYGMLLNDAGRAAPLLTALLRRSPGCMDLEACEQIIGQIAQRNMPAETAAFIQAVLAANPFADGPLQSLVEIDPAAAEAILQRRLGERPEDVAALRILAGLYRQRGDTARMVDAYRRIAELDHEPGSLKEVIAVDARAGLELALEAADGSQNDEVIGALGLAYVGTGQVEEAFRAFARAQAIDLEDYEWLKPLVELDAARAAEVLAGPALREGAGDELVGAYGNALLDTGRAKEAYEQYARALAMDPGDAEWQFGLARADPQRAVARLEELVEQEPDCPYRSGALGAALAAAGQREQGLARMEASVRHTPDYRTVGELCRADEERGRAALARLMRDDPNNDEWHGILGEMAARAGHREEALAHYEKARALDPSDDFWPRRIALLRAGR